MALETAQAGRGAREVREVREVLTEAARAEGQSRRRRRQGRARKGWVGAKRVVRGERLSLHQVVVVEVGVAVDKTVVRAVAVVAERARTMPRQLEGGGVGRATILIKVAAAAGARCRRRSPWGAGGRDASVVGGRSRCLTLTTSQASLLPRGRDDTVE